MHRCASYGSIRFVTKRRKGDTKEGGGNEAGNREAHTRNRADLATQADAEHNGGSKSHTGARFYKDDDIVIIITKYLV
jgi:hypothetical protein